MKRKALTTSRMGLAQRRLVGPALRPRRRADEWQLLGAMTCVVWRGDAWFETGINGYLFDGGASRCDRVPGWYGYAASSQVLTDAVTSTYMSKRHPDHAPRANEVTYVAYKSDWWHKGWTNSNILFDSYDLDEIMRRPGPYWRSHWSEACRPFMRILGTW